MRLETDDAVDDMHGPSNDQDLQLRVTANRFKAGDG
jgi:hypothetical protein